jgi:hypothetical protein
MTSISRSTKYGLAIILLAVFAAWFAFSRSDEKQIRQVLKQARSLAEVKDTEHPIERLGKAKQLSKLCAEDFTVELPQYQQKRISFKSRKEIEQKISFARSELKSLEIALQNVSVRIKGEEAEVMLTVSALGSMPGAEGQFLEIHTFSVSLVKAEGHWLAKKATHIRNERGEAKRGG